eukprot:3615715-Pleurochrysis_carterae.AAC.1
MAALPVVSSDDEVWSTAKSLLGDRDKHEQNAALNDTEAAMFAAAFGLAPDTGSGLEGSPLSD